MEWYERKDLGELITPGKLHILATKNSKTKDDLICVVTFESYSGLLLLIHYYDKMC